MPRHRTEQQSKAKVTGFLVAYSFLLARATRWSRGEGEVFDDELLGELPLNLVGMIKFDNLQE